LALPPGFFTADVLSRSQQYDVPLISASLGRHPGSAVVRAVEKSAHPVVGLTAFGLRIQFFTQSRRSIDLRQVGPASGCWCRTLRLVA
jgi:hypothetical protein